MQGFIDRQYKTLFALGAGIFAITAFYSGFLQGKHSSTTESITLSCKDNVLDKLSIPLEKISSGVVAHAETNAPAAQGKYVGSKNGTKYYAPSCGSVKRIKPENYRWFTTAEDATMQGYTPGKC
jgi:hypothetical protein